MKVTDFKAAAEIFNKDAGKNALKAVAWLFAAIFCGQKAISRGYDSGASASNVKWIKAVEESGCELNFIKEGSDNTESND